MANSTNLQLPYLEAAQAQKHVTLNESLRLLDALVRTRVEQQGLTAPPGSPADGTLYIPGSGATGAWATWDFNLAYYVDGAWRKIVPKVGWIVYDADADGFFSFVGGASYWSPVPGLGSGTKPLLVVAAGQSNMEGPTLGTGGDKTTNPNVFAWDNSSAFNVATLGAAPFNTAMGTPNNIAFHFCKRLQEETGRAVYLVLYAVGGTSIADWNATYFDNLDGHVDDAIASAPLVAAGITKADVFLWHQGEDDWDTDPVAYRNGMETLRASVRGADWGSERLKFIVGELLLDDQNPTLRSLANDGSDPYIGIASKEGLDDVGDNVHFTGEACVDLGAERYFAEYENLPRFYPGASAAAGSAARELLVADRNYYVNASTGNDSNDGSSGAPWATLQKAMDVVAGLDLAIYNVTVNIADGTYTAGVLLKTIVGAGTCKFVGNETTPANVAITVSGNAFSGAARGNFRIDGVKLTATGTCVVASGGVRISMKNFQIGASGFGILVQAGSTVLIDGNWALVGNVSQRVLMASGPGASVGAGSAHTVTLTGTPSFSIFIQAEELALGRPANMTFVGSGTGKRYDAAALGLVQTNGGGATFLPGSVAGTTSGGGQYL